MPTALCYIRKSTVSYSIIVLDLANINFRPIFIFQPHHNENYLQKKNPTWIILIVLNLLSLEVPYKIFNMIKASLQTNTKAAPPVSLPTGNGRKKTVEVKKQNQDPNLLSLFWGHSLLVVCLGSTYKMTCHRPLRMSALIVQVCWSLFCH